MVRYGVDTEVWLVGFGWLARRPIVRTQHGREGPKEAVDGWGCRRSERQARPSMLFSGFLRLSLEHISVTSSSVFSLLWFPVVVTTV